MPDFDFVGEAALDMLRASLASRLPQGEHLAFGKIAREFLQIRTMDNRVVPFVLKPLQKRYLAMKRLARSQGKRPRYLLLKYRRGGYTTLEQGLSYYMTTRRRNVAVLTLAQDAETTARIFRIARLMHERDPKAPPIKGPGNQYKLEFPGLNSIFYLGTAGGRSVARGDTLSRAHWSEVAWSCPGANQRMNQQAILTGITEAASTGEVVLETTPNGSEYFRELYVEAKQGGNDWVPIFLRWYDDPFNQLPIDSEDERHEIMKRLNDEEERLVATGKVFAEHLKWRRMKQRELKHLYYQEYPDDDETCWLMTGTHFFDTKRALMLRDFCSEPELDISYIGGGRPPNASVVPNGWTIEWEAPKPGVDYCIGVDTSEGLPGRDPNGLGVMRRDNGKQVAATHGLFSIREQASHVVRMSKRYNDALVGIERENHGHAVIVKCMDHGLERAHHEGGSLYYHSLGRESSVDDRPVTRAGFSTNRITRPVMLDGLRDWMDLDGAEERCSDRLFLNEVLTFRLQPDGKFGADSGCHDDAVMKWAICNEMRTVDWRRQKMRVVPLSRWR